MLVAGVPAQARRVDGPVSVIAMIDSGVNPYSPAFRDRSALAFRHPSTYIEGYPRDARALHLTLNTRTLAEALAADRRIWARVQPNTLYWIPGTKIIGAISLGSGGVRCPFRRGGISIAFPPPAGAVQGPCEEERTILDDHGHGTSTASRAAGTPHSLAPGARLVIVEGLGVASSRWAADQSWIDVQSNSWGFLTGVSPGASSAFVQMAQEQLVVTASGNGVGFSGVAPEPTYIHALAVSGVVVVGGHDNGNVTAWSGAPAQVVADAYSPYTALWNSKSPMTPDPVACCTSTATPYVAGAAARIIAEARAILGDHRTGVHDGVVARGRKGHVSSGPLADGVLTLEEVRTILYRTAEARPRAGRDDGAIHPSGDPAGAAMGNPVLDTLQRLLLEDGPGQNPYCQGCWTLPVPWSQVPRDVPAYPFIGYGAVNERTVALASAVLHGRRPLPERSTEDSFFAQDRQIRETLWGAP